RPGEMLHEEAVLVPATFTANGRDASDVQTQRSGGLRDRLRAGWFPGQRGRPDHEGLAALVAPDRHAEMLLGDLAGGDAVGTMGTDGHSISFMRNQVHPTGGSGTFDWGHWSLAVRAAGFCFELRS